MRSLRVAFLFTALAGLLLANVASAQIAHLERIKGPPSPKPGIFGSSEDGNNAPDCDSLLIPANGDTAWRELAPLFGFERVQDAYIDADLNNLVSFGDTLTLDGTQCWVSWVGADYHLVPQGGSGLLIWATNQGPHNPVNPTGELWQEIQPNFTAPRLITAFNDVDLSGGTSVGDILTAGGVNYVIQDMNCAIDARQVEPGTKIPTLAEWVAWILALLLIGMGVRTLNRRRPRAAVARRGGS